MMYDLSSPGVGEGSKGTSAHLLRGHASCRGTRRAIRTCEQAIRGTSGRLARQP
jgi:hypothetical protein